MSHRTTPFFPPTPPYPLVPAKPPRALFDALDHARFDEVRRAVTSNPSSLQATRTPRSSLSSRPLNVIDYALSNCRTWLALVEHCQRTGVSPPSAGSLTFRERLGAMNVIVTWLLERETSPLPCIDALHTAIMCGFDLVVDKLLRVYPNLVHGRDARGKGCVHVCCAVAGRGDVGLMKRFLRKMMELRVDVNQVDMDGNTGMHELVKGVCVEGGLVRRGGRSLKGVGGVVDEMLLGGTDLWKRNKTGERVWDVAMAGGVDYLEIVKRCDWIYRVVRGMRKDWGKEGGMGVWGRLPEEVVVRIFKMVGGRELLMGVGSCCRGLRRLATSEEVWEEFKMVVVLKGIREGVRREVERDGGSSSTV